MRSYLPIAAAAFIVLLLAGCKGEPTGEPAAAAAPTPPPVTFASTLEGEALVQHDRLSQEDGLNLEAMANFLGTEMVTEWLLVLAGPASDRFASTLEGGARSTHDNLSRKGKRTFELIALISDKLATDWLFAGYRTPVEAFGPAIERPAQPPLAPVIKREALVPYARLGSIGRSEFEFFVKAVGFEAAEESLLRYRGQVFMVPLPPLESALSADEVAKLEALDPRIRGPFVEGWEYGLQIYVPSPSDPTAGLAFTDPKAYVAQRTEEETKLTREVLMALPTELPPIEDLAFPEAVAEYEKLHPDVKEMFWDQVGRFYAHGITVGKGEFRPLIDSEIKELFSPHVASWTRFQAVSSKYRDKET